MRTAAAQVAAMVVACLAGSVSGHSIELGPCKSVPSDPSFQPEQLTGRWYVIEMFSTSSRCFTITFNRTADGFTGTEEREYFLGRKIGLDHFVANTGVFTIKNPANPAVMKVNWPGNIFGIQPEVTVVDIESGVYAVLYECQSLAVMRRTSAVILSRKPTLDAAVVGQVKRDLALLDIDVSDFDVISHSDCKKYGEADFNINLNDAFGDILPIQGGTVSPDAIDLRNVFNTADQLENEVSGR